VNAVNDAPVAADNSYSTNEDTALSISATGVLGNDTDVEAGTLTAAVVSGPAHGSLSLNADGSFLYTPDANYNGADSFTYKANDGTADSNVATVNITVTAVNDAPSFVKGADQVVNEDAGAQSVSAWATSIAAGPVNEASQTVTFNVTANSNPTLFSAAPSVSSNGTLTFTPAANANGSATVTLTLSDNGGTANGGADTSAPQTFTIDVNAVNDAPTVSAPSNQTINEDTSTGALSFTIGDVDTTVASLLVTASSSNTTIIPNGNVVIGGSGASRTVTVTPAANQNGGPVTITLSVSDGTTTTPSTFTVTVTPVNDAPTLAHIGDQTVNETSNLSFTASGSDIDVPAQTLTYALANGTTSCGSVTSCTVPSGTAIDGTTGVFSWTPTALQGPGTYRFKVQVSDGVTTTAEEITVTVNDVVVANPQLVFTTAPQLVTAGTASGVMTIERQTAAAIPQTAGALVVNLSSSSAGGAFRNAADTATITTVTIPNGASTVSFRYLDSVAGSPTITIASSGYTSGTQSETVQLPALVFTSAAQSTTPGASTGAITVQRQMAGGSAQTAGSLLVNLSSTAGSGVFRNSADTANITSVTIAAGTSTASFRYRDSAGGTPTITAASAGYTSATQTVTVTASPKLVFSTSPQTTITGVSTGTMTVQRQTFGGSAITTGSLVVNLASTAGGGLFRDTADTATITSVTITTGTSTASFRYRDSAAGTPTITASATGLTSASQTVTVTASPKLVFTTAAQTTAPGSATGTITVQRRTAADVAITSGSTTVNLTDTSATGVFRNSANSATITTVTIPNGSSSASFRYRDSSIGTPTITASAAGYTSAPQTVKVDTAPTIVGLPGSRSTHRNTAITIGFLVGDADTGASSVTLSATSSNSSVVQNSGITFPDNSGLSRSIRIAPRTGATGTTTITVTATDGLLTTTRSFTVTVTP
jgi:VCBS repeat-containing protein